MVNPAAFYEAAQLTNAAVTLYTSPSAVQSVIKKITLCNSDGSNGYLVTIYLVPSGGAPGVANLLVNQRPIGPKQTLDITEASPHVLAPGDFISALADTGAKVDIRISGVLIS